MTLLVINENKIFCLALIGSLFIHGLFFIFSGKTFIQHAQFNVQSSSLMVEVSIAPKDSLVSTSETSVNIGPSVKSIPHHDLGHGVSHASLGFKVKANPDYFQNPPPDYPELAKQMRQEGVVLLSVDVNGQGIPMRVDIVQSSGYRMLDQAALKAVIHWKFQPGSIGGINVESTVTVPIRFRLEK